jgi:hypothetical protein
MREATVPEPARGVNLNRRKVIVVVIVIVESPDVPMTETRDISRQK